MKTKSTKGEPMKDRNTQRSIEIDIEFIQEIQEKIEDSDSLSAWELLDDWKDELNSLIEKR